MADTFAGLFEVWMSPRFFDVGCLSIEIEIGTLGWSLSRARLHSPFEKMWCSSLVDKGLLVVLLDVGVLRRRRLLRCLWVVDPLTGREALEAIWKIGSDASTACTLAGCWRRRCRRTL